MHYYITKSYLITLLVLLSTKALAHAKKAPMVLKYLVNMPGTEIGVPLAGTVDVTIDWGDGINDKYNTKGVKTHAYDNTGTYIVKIYGNLSAFGNKGISEELAECLIEVSDFGGVGIKSFNHAFRNAVNLQKVPSYLPASATDLSHMFSRTESFNQDWHVECKQCDKHALHVFFCYIF